MADLEKKFSDFQESECIPEPSDDTIGEKICPTCQPNPSWVLPAAHWSDIKEAYLNENKCEYHVRVYEGEPIIKEKISKGTSLDAALIQVGAERIIVDTDKPLNSGVKTQVINASYIADNYRDEYSGQLGRAFLVACPAFNVDQIESNNSENSDKEDDTITSEEIIIDFVGLYDKFQKISFALRTYKFYYSMSQKVGDGFVIRQIDDETQRINYEETRKKLKKFRKELSNVLSGEGYPKIGYTGIFKSKRPNRIKFTFKNNGKRFSLDKVYVLPDDGCGKYKKVPVKSSSPLRYESMSVIYNFLSRLDLIIGQLTAKETPPWLDFTIENFYPEYVVDYGNLSNNIDDTRIGLECLLEQELGLGDGKVIDSLTREIMSSFNLLEDQLSKEACRNTDRMVEGGVTQLSQNNIDNSKTPREEREAQVISRYKKEFENKAYTQLINNIKDSIPEDNRKNINKDNIFSFISRGIGIDPIAEGYSITYVSVPYKRSGDSTPTTFERNITSKKSLEEAANEFANQKFNALEEGNFKDQIQNSPHYQQAEEAAREAISNFGSSYFNKAKDAESGESDDDIPDVMKAIGLCGVSKLTGKALQCLAGGVTFDKFMATIVDKIFDYMEMVTLNNFLNGLPAGLRADIQDEMEKQFGVSINLRELIAIQLATNPSAKISDFTTDDKDLIKQMYEKYLDPFRFASGQEIGTIESAFGKYLDNYDFYNEILNLYAYHYDFVDKKYEDEEYVDTKLEAMISNYQSKSTDFIAATERLQSSLETESTGNPEDLNRYEKAGESLEQTALGVKVDKVYDVIYKFLKSYLKNTLGIERLFQIFKKYPAVDFIIDRVWGSLSSCPTNTIFSPPAKDFMKTLSVDICDPTMSLSIPKIEIPSSNLRYIFESQFGEVFREAIIKLISELAVSILIKVLKTIEGTLCKLAGIPARMLTGESKGNLKDSFIEALNTAFCGDSINPDTGNNRANELANALFSAQFSGSPSDYEGSGDKVSNIISSVATTDEFLSAMVSRDGEEDEQFNNRISNAINYLAPEMNALLGDPNQVAYFFKNLGSYLTPDEKERIRNLLDSGIPNLPISNAICLTNDQLKEWDNLREQLLGGLNPAEAVRKLNEATESALDDYADLIAQLDTGGPFVGALSNEIGKDVCNPNNLINDVSQSEIDKTLEDEQISNFYENLSRMIQNGFFNRGGILGEATRDTLNKKEFWRGFQKSIRPNYSNTQQERDAKYSKSNFKRLMNIGYDASEGAPGLYPETVGRKQRDDLLNDGISFNFNKIKDGKRSSKNVVFKYEDVEDGFSYKQLIAASNIRKSVKNFGYNLQVIENIDDKGDTIEINFNTPSPLSQAEKDFLLQNGSDITSLNGQDVRRESFKILMKQKLIENIDYDALYEKIYEALQKNIVEGLLSNYEKEDLLPIGYRFGYVSDDLTNSSFEYTPSEIEGELGTFASNRIIPLNPNIYGGTFESPPFYVEPRKFTGWLELATSAFDSEEGCDPKTPPLLSFNDISERTRMLSKNMRNDPRLSKSPECVSIKPFHLLLDSKNKSKLDGVVRTTIRTYMAEFFMKGYGLYSNLLIKPENFDDSMMKYVVEKMKTEMSDLGSFTSNRKIRITRERYWYTFLEQCVEAYQRMVDYDGVKPPANVYNALNRIQIGLDKYKPIDVDMKKRIRKNFDNISKIKPPMNYDPISEISNGMQRHMVMAVAFRLSNTEERENFFDNSEDNKVKSSMFRFSSIKKLKFFQKIYFIKLFEKEAILVMEELLKDEFARLSILVMDGPTDKPYYLDLYKSFFGMKSFFPQSNSRVGLSSYELDKQRGLLLPGDIPTIKSSTFQPPVEQSDQVQFVVESYARLEEKLNTDIPDFIRNRSIKYSGMVSLTDLSDFIDQNLDLLEDKYLSDYFGDLKFIYKGSFREIMNKGFGDSIGLTKLIELNQDIGRIKIEKAFNDFIASRPFEDFEVMYDDHFLLEGENPSPIKTTGSTGVKYGIRVSVMLPNDLLSTSEISALRSNQEIVNKSLLEKSYLFDDNSVMIPIASQEISVVDSLFSDFDPFSGREPYDLECLINKIVDNPEFKIMFDKIFGLRQASSMLAIYCMETLPASIGRGVDERVEGKDPDGDDWDRQSNKWAKNFLRREFKSLYLSNTEDGLSPDDDDDGSGLEFKLNNPFDFLKLPSIKLPWWKSRRLKTKIYDANGEECASPEKDLL